MNPRRNFSVLAFVIGLQPFSVSSSDAIAASLFYHVLVCGSLIVAGSVAERRPGHRRHAQRVQRVEDRTGPPPSDLDPA